MSLYFDCMLDSTSSTSSVCWHKHHDLLAVCCNAHDGMEGFVKLYHKDGRRVSSPIQRSSSPTFASWHPVLKLLAVGWRNGEILIWNEQQKELHQLPSLHTKSITALTWSSNGSRIASGDDEGVFAVWKIDSRGRVQHNPLSRHDLGPSVSDCAVRPGLEGDEDPHLSNIVRLAKAAVSGDESAMDLLADYKKGMGSRMKLQAKQKEGLSFYVGTSDGVVHLIDDEGTRSLCCTLDSSVLQILCCKKHSLLVAISHDLQVIKCKLNEDGQTEELARVKFSGKDGSAKISWADEALLVAATSDRSLRLWDLVSGDNYTLLLDESCGFKKGEVITDAACSQAKGIIAAATSENNIAIWKSVPQKQNVPIEPEERWKLQPAVKAELPPNQLMWCFTHPVLALGSGEGAMLLTEEKPKFALSSTMVVAQTGPCSVSVDFIGKKALQQSSLTGLGLSPIHAAEIDSTVGGHVDIKTDVRFNGIAAASEHLVVWNGKEAVVYEVTRTAQTALGIFKCETHSVAIHDQSVFCVVSPVDSKDRSKIQAQNFQGTVKQIIHVQENEGDPVLLSISGDFMVVGTSAGFIKVYDLSRRDAKLTYNSKPIGQTIERFGMFQMISCNHNGSKVAFLVNKDLTIPPYRQKFQDNDDPDSRVWVYDAESDKVYSFDFLCGKNDQDDFTNDSGPKSDMEESRADAAMEITGRYPISVHWDAMESRMLSCEARISTAAQSTPHADSSQASMPPLKSGSRDVTSSTTEVMVATFYATQDQGIILQDSFNQSSNYEDLIGLKVPHFFFTKSATSAARESQETNSEESVGEKSSSLRKKMRDFVGLNDNDRSSINAMLNFSFYLTIGDMDEAFKAIKLIKGAAVWESMARMCVKSRRLDVAKVCLANMGHARGARALKEAEKEPERDARIARLALELGMNDEAENLYKHCQRYDLLNLFYQATGQWAKALDTAEQFDRIHLRSTFYNYAKQLEASGETANAIPNYEKSGTHYFEVPRMLFDESEMLEAYIMKSKDKKLRKWWAQYMESTGDMDTALKFYQQAGDPLSLVRVYCYCGNPDKAAAVANETGDRAACYHLARQFENNDDIKQAIHFFTRAMAYGNAIRICKEHGFEDRLMNLALLSTPADMVEAARYYEEKPDSLDKAVMLYHKAGHFSKALELAFESQQFGALELISQELDERTDPDLLERCAEFFTEHSQHDQAVAMLVIAKKYEEAIRVCSNNDVRLNEALVEKLTVPKEVMDEGQRERLLFELADLCMKQGEYHLACRKYTQAGDKEKAMRALLKSGDTERIMFFAGVSRARNIYVMAANYLQSLDWRKDPNIMKGIINFYTKGRALDSLAGFYDACAQVEIDEYQNYEKAVGALTEAFKCLTKAKMADRQQQEGKVTEIKSRIALVKKFIQTRRLFESEPEEAVKQCHVLLDEPELESSVRYGDVYGLLVEYFASQDNFDKAYQHMQDLRSRLPTINLSYYINMRTIEVVHRAVGVPVRRGDTYGNGDAAKLVRDDTDDVDNVEDEEVTEELYDDDNGNAFAFR